MRRIPLSFSPSFLAVLVLVLALCMATLLRLPVRTARAAPQRLAQGQLQQTRAFGGSTSSHKALPFSLQSNRSSTKDDKESGKVLRMLMFGKPGAGKGTLSARLVKKYDVLTLSTGDLLRQHIAER